MLYKYTIVRTKVTFADKTKHFDNSRICTNDIEKTRRLINAIYSNHQCCTIQFRFKENKQKTSK